MVILIAIGKATGGPGSIGFFLLCAVVGMLVRRMGPRWRRLTSLGFVLLVGSYLVLSLPIVANSLADSVTSYRPLESLSSLQGVDTLVVLDGDNRRGRVREARRVFDGIKPERVIVSGSTWLLDALIEAGIPEERVTHETQSATTLEQLQMLRTDGLGTSALVASRLQMPRIAMLAKTVGILPELVPASIDIEPPTSGMRRFIPAYIALRVSRDALYELMALAYYGQ
jgi:uncharacterized SAM-binding protein YcdF (DUF218 family)